jgi:glycosyltransferase involved in cell wall biosynthesis
MKLSVIVLTKNEQEMIRDCLQSARQLAGEIIVVDSGSTDDTVKIATEFGAKIIATSGDYASLRNAGLEAASGEWVFYLDADERVSPQLAQEILASQGVALRSYKLPRKNIVFGRWIKHGGYWPDPVHRLFQKEALKGWTGKLHESPQVVGQIGQLKQPLAHYTVRSMAAALEKSRDWSAIEAQLLYEAKVPRVAWWKIIKAFKFEFIKLFIFKLGFLDGMPGFILAYIRAYHQASVLVNLWQKQQQS